MKGRSWVKGEHIHVEFGNGETPLLAHHRRSNSVSSMVKEKPNHSVICWNLCPEEHYFHLTLAIIY